MSVRAQGIPTALVYTRVSNDEQARDGVSLEAQQADCRRYAAGQGWLLHAEYRDVLSGRRDDRPGYQSMLAELRRLRSAGERPAVVVAKLDRLGRRLTERVRCREELRNLGVPVHSAREGGEVLDIVANVLAAVAEEESRLIGERIAASRAHFRRGGWYLPGPAPWGYRWRPATEDERAQGAPRSVLVSDPVSSPYVVEAFRRAAADESVWSLRSWAAQLPDEVRGGRKMQFEAIRKILASPVYAGRHPGRLEDPLAGPSGRWPALVDDGTWRRVRDRVKDHQRIPRQASRTFLLTGFTRCPLCGDRMHGVRRPGRSDGYECVAKERAAPSAIPHSFSALAPQIDAQVLAEVLRVVEATVELPVLRRPIAEAWEVLRQPLDEAGDVERRFAFLEQSAGRLRQRLARHTNLLADGTIDLDAYRLAADATKSDLESVEAELGRLRSISMPPILPPIQDVLREADVWSTAVHQGRIPEQREVLKLLVERVVPARTGRGQYAVEIAWTPLGEALRVLPGSA